MLEYILSSEAVDDLQSIWDFIAFDNEAAADRMIDRMLDAFEQLAQWPGLGHVRRDLTKRTVLFWPLESYLIVYRHHRKRLQIVAILHGARDIPTVIGKRKT